MMTQVKVFEGDDRQDEEAMLGCIRTVDQEKEPGVGNGIRADPVMD